MQVYTNIGTAVPQVPPPRMPAAPGQYGSQAVQQHFSDLYRPAAQKAVVDLGRAQTQAAADYTSRATAAQRQAALAGLGLLAQQRQNAQQRDLEMQDMAYDWMRQMGGSGVLGGLL